MSDEEKKAAELNAKLNEADSRKRADAEAGEKLDKLLKVMDGCAKGIDAISKRVDALEKQKPNKDTTAEVVSDESDDEDENEDEPSSAPEREPDVEAANEKRRKLREKMADAQARCDSIAHLFGRQAPPPMAAETLPNYRRRILREFQHYSTDFKAVDLSNLKGQVFDAVENRIYADAREIGSRPPTAGPGELREIKRRDQSGREISEFVGDPRVVYNPQGEMRRYVRGLNQVERTL